MSRLIRIALTLFASATILLILVQMRARRLQIEVEAGLAEDLIRDESRMILVGVILSGGLAAGGFALLIITVVRSRRKALQKHGD